jgi:cell division protein FtsQ
MNAVVRLIAWLLALAVVTLPVVAVLNGWFASERWPLSQLRVSAEFQRVSAEQLQAAVRPHLGQGFFAVDLEATRAAVAALPWVEQVAVRKLWPDTLEIALVEHRALARWGESRLLSDRGRLFEVPDLETLQGLPRFDAEDAQIAEVMQMHAHAQALLSLVGDSQLALQLSPRGSWTLQLASGTELVLGRSEPEARLQRFVEALPELRRAASRPLLRADLRYANGFALLWAEPQAPVDATSADPRQPT